MKLINHRDLSVTGRHPDYRINLAGGLVVAELRPENMIRRNDVFERRLDHFFRRSRNDIEGEAVVVKPLLEEPQQLLYVLLEADSFAHLDQVLFTDTTVFGVVQQQVSQFASLLDQVHIRQARHLFTKPGVTQEFTENNSRIVKAQSLIEIAGQ